MRLIWNGHSCFTLETAGGTVVVDPYLDGSVPGLAPIRLRADAVYCSHDHRDHGARELVALTGEKPDVAVETIHTWHDDQQGAQRGPNTIHIFQAEGLRVAHLGDLGCELEPEQMDALKGLDALMIPVGGFYTIDAGQARALVEQLKPRVTIPMHYRSASFGYDVIAPLEDYLALCGLDALLIPVGGFYTIDAKQARALVDQLKPRVTVPMHYRGGSFGYDVIGPLEDYLELCGDVVRYPGNVLVLDKDTPGQTAVLTYCPQK